MEDLFILDTSFFTSLSDSAICDTFETSSLYLSSMLETLDDSNLVRQLLQNHLKLLFVDGVFRSFSKEMLQMFSCLSVTAEQIA